MRRLVVPLVTALVPVAAVGVGSWLSIACDGAGGDCSDDTDCPAGQFCDDGGKCEIGGGDDGVTEVGDGGADEGSATSVDGSALPVRIFGTADGGGVHAGLTGFYVVTGLSGTINVTLEDFAEALTGCPSTSTITLTGLDTTEIFGGLGGTDCPTVPVDAAADGTIVINWQGASPTDYGLKLAAP